VVLIEKALEGFKSRMRDKSGAPPGYRVKVNGHLLGEVLASYGIFVSNDELRHVFSGCHWGRKEATSQDIMKRHATFDMLLTSIPLWRLILVRRQLYSNLFCKLTMPSHLRL